MYDLERKLDVEATATKLDELSARALESVGEFRQELDGSDFEWRRALEWNLGTSVANKWLAERYSELAQAIRASEGNPPRQPQHEHKAGETEDGETFEENVTHRHISPEEQVDWAMSNALDVVLVNTRDPWSRSTSASSNFVEDMHAGAAIEFLSRLGWAAIGGGYTWGGPLVLAREEG